MNRDRISCIYFYTSKNTNTYIFFFTYYDFSYLIIAVNNMKGLASSALWKHKQNTNTAIKKEHRHYTDCCRVTQQGLVAYHSLQAAGRSSFLFHLISLPSPANCRVYLRRGWTLCGTLSIPYLYTTLCQCAAEGYCFEMICSRPECLEL